MNHFPAGFFFPGSFYYPMALLLCLILLEASLQTLFGWKNSHQLVLLAGAVHVDDSRVKLKP